ncbi:MAG: radical SAM protein [Candidatus Omnitrophica bacterium]|nr:radical SAM protein [Candidatus Omnitrophota bacterium]MBD3268898.1 radical SAM protein [Candidatus Omnitrophota bacterium]
MKTKKDTAIKCLDNSTNTFTLLIRPPYKKETWASGKEIPLGISYIASYLESQNISSEIFDMQVYSEPYDLLGQVLVKRKPEIIGITANTVNIFDAAGVAKFIKNHNKKIITVIGGAQASALPKETLEYFPCFDYLIYGEGEVTFYKLIDSIINKTDSTHIEGLAYREKKNVCINPERELIKNIDEIPFPAREKLDIHRYHPCFGHYYKLPSTGLYTIRGCPYNCSFCCSDNVWSNRVRPMSAKRVIEEIKHCMVKYNIRDFSFNDDVFTLFRNRVFEICSTIIQEDLNITWNCWSRVDTVDYEMLQCMKRAGCFNIRYGVDAVSPYSLRISSKGTTAEQAENAVELTKAAGIHCSANFIIGFPGESIEDINKAIAFSKKLKSDHAVYNFFGPGPGSPIFKELLVGKYPDTLWGSIFKKFVSEKNRIDQQIDLEFLKFLSGQTKATILDEHEKKAIRTLSITIIKAYIKFYLSPQYVGKKLKLIIKNPKQEIRFLWYGFRHFFIAIKILTRISSLK